MAVYATLAEARTYGILAGQAADAVVTSYLEIASRVVDNYTGTTFDPASVRTVTVSDVRNPLVRLPSPFSTVTAVTVNGAAISATGYTQEDWGLRLYTAGYFDGDGFPYRSFSSLRAGRGPFGSVVKVTATYGYTTVPTPVREATLAVTADLIARAAFRPTSTVDAEGNVSVLPVVADEPGVSAEATTDERGPKIDTTGSLLADRLLQPYRNTAAMVG